MNAYFDNVLVLGLFGFSSGDREGQHVIFRDVIFRDVVRDISRCDILRSHPLDLFCMRVTWFLYIVCHMWYIIWHDSIISYVVVVVAAIYIVLLYRCNMHRSANNW